MVSGRPRRCKLARAFLWEYSDKSLKLAQLLGQLGVFLTWSSAAAWNPPRPPPSAARGATPAGGAAAAAARRRVKRGWGAGAAAGGGALAASSAAEGLPAARVQATQNLRRVRSHCRFRNRGTEYVSEFGIKWLSGGAKRQCDRALAEPHAARAGGQRRPQAVEVVAAVAAVAEQHVCVVRPEPTDLHARSAAVTYFRKYYAAPRKTRSVLVLCRQ